MPPNYNTSLSKCWEKVKFRLLLGSRGRLGRCDDLVQFLENVFCHLPDRHSVRRGTVYGLGRNLCRLKGTDLLALRRWRIKTAQLLHTAYHLERVSSLVNHFVPIAPPMHHLPLALKQEIMLFFFFFFFLSSMCFSSTTERERDLYDKVNGLGESPYLGGGN